jgi:tRNA pseudouridine38-40 synthase
MRTLKITLAYDGTRFVGWQRQADGESIQGLLEDALARFEGGPVTTHGAGRTDAGVHALGQVASARVTFTHDAGTLTRALNAHLPEDVRVTLVEDAEEAFHARFSASAKTYRYQIRNTAVADPFDRTFTWHLPEPLSLDAMARAAALLVGTHDFDAFRSAGSGVSSSVRTVTRSEWRVVNSQPPTPNSQRCSTWELGVGSWEFGPLLTYEISGDGFLRHMVRAIVGTLVEIGRGWRQVDQITALLTGGTRAQAGATAPPHGLFLVSVDYD